MLLDSDAYLCRLADIFDGIYLSIPDVPAITAIVLTVIFLLISAFVSAFEAALSSLSPSAAEILAEHMHTKKEKIGKLLEDAERLSATIAVTRYFAGVAVVILICYFCANIFHPASPSTRLFLPAAASVLLLLLFGNILPKIWGSQKPSSFCRFAAPGVYFSYTLFYPLVSALISAEHFFDKHLTRKKTHNISVDELSQALEMTDRGELSEENKLLEGIIRFGDETAKEVMTSRLDLVDLEINTSFKDVLKCIEENVYSRIPVYGGNRDNIKGILYIKDLLPHLNKGANFRWQSLIRPAYFVPETKRIDELLRDFQANKIHIAIVVDEFGGTSGIVTMEDVIEEIVGEIHDEYDEEERTYVELNDHTWIFKGKTLLVDFYKITGLDEKEFEEAAGDADTLAGFLLELKGEFPALHEKLEYGRYEFEILEMDNRRILKVKFAVNSDRLPEQGTHPQD